MPDPALREAPLSPGVVDAALDLWAKAGEQHWLPIAGHSMRPLIRDGDRVLVAYGTANVRRGDVIVYARGGRPFAHRVLRVDRGTRGYLTKGDAVHHLDPVVHAEEVIGRALAVERDGRRASLDTPAWRAAGWLVAVHTLAWRVLLGRGVQPRSLAASLVRGEDRLATAAMRWLAALACRWQKVASTERRRAPDKKSPAVRLRPPTSPRR